MDKLIMVIKSIFRSKEIDLSSIDLKIKKMHDLKILHNTIDDAKAM